MVRVLGAHLTAERTRHLCTSSLRVFRLMAPEGPLSHADVRSIVSHIKRDAGGGSGAGGATSALVKVGTGDEAVDSDGAMNTAGTEVFVTSLFLVS